MFIIKTQIKFNYLASLLPCIYFSLLCSFWSLQPVDGHDFSRKMNYSGPKNLLSLFSFSIMKSVTQILRSSQTDQDISHSLVITLHVLVRHNEFKELLLIFEVKTSACWHMHTHTQFFHHFKTLHKPECLNKINYFL